MNRVELWTTVNKGKNKQLLFSHEELESPDTHEVRLADGFALELIRLRATGGKPMKVNSCCRSAAHNLAIGGHPRSLHIYDAPQHGLNGCAAIDIATPDAPQRAKLRRLAWGMGWSVGLGRWFLHLDRRDLAGLPQREFN